MLLLKPRHTFLNTGTDRSWSYNEVIFLIVSIPPVDGALVMRSAKF